MHQIAAVIPAEVLAQPLTVANPVAGPGPEGADRETAIAAGPPGMQIVGIGHGVDDVGLAVAVDVSGHPLAVGNRIASPGTESADIERTIAIRHPGMRIVAVGDRVEQVGLAIAIEVTGHPDPVGNTVAGPGAEGTDVEAAVAVRHPGVHVVGVGHRMHDVGLAVAVQVGSHPVAVRNPVAGPGPEGADVEGAVAVRHPGMHIVRVGHRMHDVGLAVAVDVGCQPDPVGDGVAGPGAEGAHGMGAVTVRDPGVHIVTVVDRMHHVQASVAVQVGAQPVAVGQGVVAPWTRLRDREPARTVGTQRGDQPRTVSVGQSGQAEQWHQAENRCKRPCGHRPVRTPRFHCHPVSCVHLPLP